MANMSEDEKSRREVAIVGGGLVGALSAVFFAKRGYKVDLYESRQDPRKLQFVSLRSINLALSVRGISALAAVGCERPMVESGIPMHARMIHTLKGSKYAIPYGKKGQYIMSVERRKMNEHLLTVAESHPNVTLHFGHKLKKVDVEKAHMTYKTSSAGEVVDVDADLLVGCDGAYSAVRKEIMRRPRFDYSQEYIPHGYKEICLPPDANGKHIMELNYLHIWPRNTFMMIALPNQDGTFTCTLFAPFDTFDEIKTNDDVLNFFNKEFLDFIPLIGEEKLLSDWFTNPVGAMVSVKCKPYHALNSLIHFHFCLQCKPYHALNSLIHFHFSLQCKPYHALNSLIHFHFFLQCKPYHALNSLIHFHFFLQCKPATMP
ncbi:kynurenine 3-monooxygenase isoform X2 [Nematostella vectensis]|uniref:kynurenine 3-monooxygenase isoform X2 n=1 Tax=Nematostella vectensis TaxID=45351 RepID=UPI0020778C2A|nr:kynurenine 3-monooxygenase isoform X2 [Nematostella vectensis]